MPSADSKDMTSRLEEFLEWLLVRGYSERTVWNHRKCLGYFIAWCAERNVVQPGEVTKPIMERYQRYLYHYRNENPPPFAHCG